jgi:hypothetical protein
MTLRNARKSPGDITDITACHKRLTTATAARRSSTEKNGDKLPSINY